MSLRVLSGSDAAPLEPLLDKVVTVVGFGNQGAAHALNLRDSGVDVVVANRADTGGWQRALAHGFEPVPIDAGVRRADLVIIALPDEEHAAAWTAQIAPHIRPGSVAGFLHGFSVRYGLVEPPPDIGVVMVAPKGPGRTLRLRFEEGHGIPCLFAVAQESPRSGEAERLGLAWANGIGCARAAVVYTSFGDEAETDLFGEQTVLCGGMTWLIRVAFETLVAQGYAPELAYLECCHEVKQVADLVYERGLAGMMEAISNTAEFGAHHAGPRLVDEAVGARVEAILKGIRDGTFAAALREDHEEGHPWFNARRAELRRHPMEEAGAIVRAWMTGGEAPGGSTTPPGEARRVAESRGGPDES